MVALILRERPNLAPDRLEIVGLAPTVRVPDTRHLTELRFVVPDDVRQLTVRNFDAANRTLELTSGFDAVPLVASVQDESRDTEVPIRPEQRGEAVAIVLAGGEEIPDDVTVAVLDQAGRPVPLQLPARLWLPDGRPLSAGDVELLANCVSVALDASRSSDPDGDQLAYEWLFGDGTAASGRALVHEDPGPGTYRAALRVLDSSGSGRRRRRPAARGVRQAAAARGPAPTGWWRRASRSSSTAPVLRPASGRSPAMCGTSTTAAAPRA